MRPARVVSGAVFSQCGRYRYRLWRVWDPDRPPVAFIGLNPSTADAERNDPTIRRSIGFARTWGYGGVCVFNLFAFRATYPKDLFAARDPVGPANTPRHIRRWIERAGCARIVAAWGAQGGRGGQARTFTDAIPGLWCLGTTAAGQPRHPLYLRASVRPVPFGWGTEARLQGMGGHARTGAAACG